MAAQPRSGWITIVSGIVIVFILIIIHSTLGRQPSLEAQPFLSIGVEDNPISSLVVIAQEEGFFDKLGLHVKLLPFDTGSAALRALLNFKVDMATTSDIPILVTAFKQKNFSIVATINRSASLAQVVVQKGRGINDPRDLTGKRIATQANSSGDYYAYLFLKHYGIPISAIQLVYMPANKLVMALRSGYVDAFVMHSPYTQEAEKYMPGQILFFNVSDLYREYLNLVVTHNGIRQHLRKIKLVIAGLRQAATFAQQNPEQAQQDAIKFFGEDLRDYIVTVWPHYDFTVSLGPDLLQSLEQQTKWIIATGKGISSQAPDLNKLIDQTPLAQVQAGQINPLPIKKTQQS